MVENIYPDPYTVRKDIIENAVWEHRIKRTYSGTNSMNAFHADYIKKVIQVALGKTPIILKNTLFGHARMTPETDKDPEAYIHVDPAEWAAIIYLNPNDEQLHPGNGTAIWRNKETGSVFHEPERT